MDFSVTSSAKGYQVFFQVFSRMATELFVVHLKIRHRPTGLTSPSIATQDLLAQIFIRQGIKVRGSDFGANHY
jgi:hypothetical protein